MIRRNPKRGQAAMEYLSTYAWAVLILVLVLTALVWLGVFNVDAPERCSFEGDVQCDDVRLEISGLVGAETVSFLHLYAVNQKSSTLYVCGVLCTNDLEETLSELDAGTITAPAECASAGQDALILQSGKRKNIAPTSSYSATVTDFDDCYEYFAGSAVTDSTYSPGDLFNGNTILFYSLATDAGTGTAARMMVGDLVIIIE